MFSSVSVFGDLPFVNRWVAVETIQKGVASAVSYCHIAPCRTFSPCLGSFALLVERPHHIHILVHIRKLSENILKYAENECRKRTEGFVSFLSCIVNVEHI